MSEVKRAKLISFGSQRVNNKNQKEVVKTVRIAVNLPESTEDKCPEFNYKDLLATAKRKHAVQKNSVPKPQPNGLDPFEDDEDVKRIAAEMEAKYGIGVAKKRKWRKDDYADIGMGYDESDSFIDNTDGYDEIIPKNVTTLHGGFYINCGALEFKTDEGATSDDSSSSDEEDTPEKPNNTRKRVLESSAESEEETTQAEKVEKSEDKEKVEHQDKKQKVVANPNGMQKAIKKRLFSHEKIKQQMRNNGKPEETKKTVRELLRERREDLNMTITIDTEPADKPADSASPPKETKKPLASIDDVIESVISGAIKKKDEHTDESSKDSIISKDGVNIINSSEADSNDGVPMKPVEIVQLPENLPGDIIEIIESIKKAAACSTEGKVKFFSGHVNTMLLDLERKCRCLGKQSRMKVYEHLAPFVKCKKETLIKRAKNLCAVDEQKKIKILLDRLKAAVGAIMPSLIENYEAECKAIVQKKFSLQSEETAKNLRMPKRQFTWNDEIKKLVKDIITLRKKCYITEGKQKEVIEKHLIEFIKTDLQVIWPDGWMSMNTLMKFYNILQDTKKNLDAPKRNTPTSTPDISISPTSNISPPNLPISSTSSLTITPVTSNVHKVSTIEAKVKPKPLNINETIISKVNSSIDSCSVSKPSKPLPAVDIIKTTPLPDVNNIKHTVSVNNVIPPILIKDEPETIVIPETPIKKEEPENLSSTHVNVIKHEQLENSANHCQIIDLTEQPELRRKPGPKSKTKYVYEFPEKSVKPKKEPPTEHIRVKQKEELTGSSVFSQIIADSLSDMNRFAQKSSNSSAITSTASISNINDSVVKKSSFDFPKTKPTSERDDIQKVMEGLMVLQKMSSPVKSNDEVKTSSPVSVIAFNKSYSHDSNSSSNAGNIASHRSSSFQDAFQKQFIPDYHLMKTNQTASTSPKGNHNSISKHNHSITKSSSTSSERYLQNSNNNYAQQNSNKLKTSCSSQQSGSYNMLDDMFANFLSEYGHSKTANSKSSSQQK